MPFGGLCIFERNSCTLKMCSLSSIQIEKSCDSRSFKNFFFRLPSAFFSTNLSPWLSKFDTVLLVEYSDNEYYVFCTDGICIQFTKG